ncbi:protein DVR-1-like [Ranitomeya variabilis]|uniref:protein DVR-1-like n=1 Tax=Ranitomeya variabilis TaxID=490064 RepID=UPI004055A519
MQWLTLGVFLSVVVPLIMDSEMSLTEEMFLRSLGFPAKPNPVSPPPIPSILWKIFNRRMDSSAHKKKQDLCFLEEFNVPGSTVRVFPDQGQLVPRSSDQPSNLCLKKRLFFKVSIIEKEEQVTMSKLEVRFGKNAYYGQTFDLRLYRILQISLRGMGDQRSSRKLLAAQSFRLLHRSLYVNLTDVCQIWRAPHKNFGLDLEILHRKDGTLDDCPDVQSFLYTSLLMVTLNPLQCKKSRKKRSYGNLPFLASNICKKRRFYVEFRHVGWQNWVIAPRGYLANDCYGECPYPLAEILNGSNHAILQALAHSLDPEDIPLPCCVPTKMSPISMLFYDNNDNVVLKHYENMSVDECGCR